MEKIVNDYIKYLDKYLEKSDNSIMSYKYDIKKFVTFCSFKEIDYRFLTKDQANEFIMYLSRDLKLSPSSINRVIASQRSFYNYLLRQGYINDNVFSSIHNMKIGRKLPSYISHDLAVDIINYKTKSRTPLRDKLVIGLMFYGGLRISEVSKILFEDVSLEEDFILIRGKGNRQRYIFIVSGLKELLENFFDSLDDHSGYLIKNHKGEKISRQSLWTITTSKSKSFDKNITPHTFRHSFATYLLSKGLSQYDIKELLGHVSISTTEIYTHVDNESLKKNMIQKITEINKEIYEK